MDSVRFHSRAVPVSPSDKKRRSRSKAPIPSEHRQATPSKAVAVQDVFEGQSSQARHRMGLSAQSLSTAAAVFTPPKSTKFPDENLLTTHVKRELNEILNLEAYIDLIEKLSEPQPSFSASEIHSLQLVSIFIRATDKVSTTPVIGDIDYTHHFHALLESAKIPIIPILSPDIYKSLNMLGHCPKALLPPQYETSVANWKKTPIKLSQTPTSEFLAAQSLKPAKDTNTISFFSFSKQVSSDDGRKKSYQSPYLLLPTFKQQVQQHRPRQEIGS